MKKIGQYEFNPCHIIGKGGFSTIYFGQKQGKNQQHQEVAIKVIDLNENPYYDYENEIKIHQKLSQSAKKNILQLLDYVIQEKKCYIVLKLCKQGTLSSLIQQKQLDIQEKLYYIFQIFQGMKYINQKNIIHRDLKLENLLLQNNQVYISDFGLAKKIPENQSEIYLDRITGSEGYMPPEIQNILELKRTKNIKPTNVPYSQKGDIYSLGIIFHQIICGYEQGFKVSDLESQEQHHIFQTADLQSKFEDFLDGMLQSDPKKRFSLQQVFDHPFFQIIKQNFIEFKEKLQQKVVNSHRNSNEIRLQLKKESSGSSSEQFNELKYIQQKQQQQKQMNNNNYDNDEDQEQEQNQKYIAIKSTLIAGAVTLLMAKGFKYVQQLG